MSAKEPEPTTRSPEGQEEMMTPTKSTSGPESRRQARWTVDLDGIEICFSVGLMKTFTVEGRFRKVRGSIVFDEGAPHLSRVDLSVEAASVDTRNPVRDLHLQTGDYLGSRRFPTITFASTHVVPLDDKRHRITGELTIRGVTREISLGVVHERDIIEFGRRRFSGETAIYRKDFGVDPGVAGLGFLIGNEVTVRVRGEATEQPHSGTKPREVFA